MIIGQGVPEQISQVIKKIYSRDQRYPCEKKTDTQIILEIQTEGEPLIHFTYTVRPFFLFKCLALSMTSFWTWIFFHILILCLMSKVKTQKLSQFFCLYNSSQNQGRFNFDTLLTHQSLFQQEKNLPKFWFQINFMIQFSPQ